MERGGAASVSNSTPSGPEDDATAVLPSAPEGARRQRRKQSNEKVRRLVIEWGLLIVAALAIAFLIKTFLFQAFYIPSGSMEPTLQVSDRVLVNKLSYHLHDVHRGDI